MHPIGGGKIELSKINDADVATLDKEFLELTYSDRERCETAPFVPDHVSLDKKVLHFKVDGSKCPTIISALEILAVVYGFRSETQEQEPKLII